jgi:hypothetical protein
MAGVLIWAALAVAAVFLAWLFTRGRSPRTWRTFLIWFLAAHPFAAFIFQVAALEEGERTLSPWFVPLMVLITVPLGYARYLVMQPGSKPLWGNWSRRDRFFGAMLILSGVGLSIFTIIGASGDGGIGFGLMFGPLAAALLCAGAADFMGSPRAVIGLRLLGLGFFVLAIATLVLAFFGAGIIDAIGRGLMSMSFLEHPWFWPGLLVLVLAEIASYLIFRRFARPELQKYAWVYAASLPVSIVVYVLVFAASAGRA